MGILSRNIFTLEGWLGLNYPGAATAGIGQQSSTPATATKSQALRPQTQGKGFAGPSPNRLAGRSEPLDFLGSDHSEQRESDLAPVCADSRWVGRNRER